MRILIVTGEASGDLHGAHLAKAIMALDPTAQLVGIGGAAMRAAGVNLVSGVPQLDVMGLIGLSAIRAMVQRVLAIRRVLKAEAWDLVVLIDNPGLNFHFARVAKAAGRRVLYYIAPQVWAWRPGPHEVDSAPGRSCRRHSPVRAGTLSPGRSSVYVRRPSIA